MVDLQKTNNSDLILAIESKMEKRLVPPRVLLSRFRFLDEGNSHASTDAFYCPFYYYLGKFYPVDSLVEFGFGIGLASSCYLKACPGAERSLFFNKKENNYYSTRLGEGNIRLAWGKRDYNVYVGQAHDLEFAELLKSRRWGLAIMNEQLSYDEHLQHLTYAWDNLQGLMVVDFIDRHPPAGKAYRDFCKIKQRQPATIKTRYGIGFVWK